MAHNDRSRISAGLEEIGAIALPLLKAVNSASNIFPPLQSATSVAITIGETVSKFKLNKKEWSKFGKYVQEALALVMRSISGASEPRKDLRECIQKLSDVLQEVEKEIVVIKAQQNAIRFFNFYKDPEKINDMKNQIQDAVGIFQLETMVTTRVDVDEILKNVKGKFGEKIINKINLGNLPYVEGASWNPARVCLKGTRTALLNNVWTWITSDSDTAKIYWLADVAGAGKSSVAHSIAEHCYKEKILASSFFFDREIAGRNSPQKLFSTIARDLASLSEDFAEQISLAVERDPSLPTAPIPRQFEQLILTPSLRISETRPLVIIIDALDEGYSRDVDLLTILRDSITRLPNIFRFIITSRGEDYITRFLQGQHHILRQSMKIHGQPNKADIAVYLERRLRDIASRRGLEADWPGAKQLGAFKSKAEGLFIWAATVCDFLDLQLDPSKHLDGLLMERTPSGLRVEVKMDKLYSTILNTCNWEDEDFVSGYDLVVGTIMAAKVPLTASALRSLHRTDLTVRAIDVLQPLESLLVGLSDEREPIRILHLSFRDFLTLRAAHSTHDRRFFINEQIHSSRLGVMCLQVLNEGLKQDICSFNDLSMRAAEFDVEGQLATSVSEELMYACAYWWDHLRDMTDSFSHDLAHGLETFQLNKLLPWIELMGWRDMIQDAIECLMNLERWIQKNLPDKHDLCEMVSDGLRFVQQFSVIITQNPLSVYASALPFTPVNTLLSKVYLPLHQKIPRIVTGIHSKWPSEVSLFRAPDATLGKFVVAVAWSNDGSRVAIGYELGHVYLWYHQRGTHVELVAPDLLQMSALQFSPDDRVIASSSLHGEVCIWDATAKSLAPVHRLTVDDGDDGVLLCLAFSPDSGIVASGSSAGSIYIWNIAAEPVLLHRLTGHDTWISALIFTSGNTELISSSGDGHTRVWDTKTWKTNHQPMEKHLTGVNSLTISSCGSLIAVGFCEGSLKVEQIQTGVARTPAKTVFTVTHSRDRTRYLLYSPDNRTQVYDSRTSSLLFGMHPKSETSFAYAVFCPCDKDKIAARCMDGSVRIYDTSTGDFTFQVISAEAGTEGPVVFSDCGKNIVFCSSDGALHIWSKEDQTSQFMTSTPSDNVLPLTLCMSPDGQSVAGFYPNSSLRVWNGSGELVVFHSFEGSEWVNLMVFSPDSSLVAVGTSDGCCHIFDIVQATYSRRLPPYDYCSAIVGLNFVVRSEVLYVVAQFFTAHKGDVAAWNTYTQGPHSPPSPYQGRSSIGPDSTFYDDGGSYSDLETTDLEAVSVFFSVDGQTLASTSSSHTQIRTWNSYSGLAEGQLITTRNREEIARVAFSSDTFRIAAGSKEGAVRVWDTHFQTECLSQFSICEKLADVVVSRDGSRIAVHRLNEDNGAIAVSLCDAATAMPISENSLHHCARFSLDGARLAGPSDDSSLVTLNSVTGEIISRSNGGLHRDSIIRGVVWAADGQHIVTESDDDTIEVWSTKDNFKEPTLLGKVLRTKNANSVLKFTSDSAKIVDVALFSASFRVWDADGNLLAERIDSGYGIDLTVHSHWTTSCENGSRFAWISRSDGSVQVWDVCTSSIILKSRTDVGNTAIKLSPDGSLLSFARNESVELWDIDGGKPTPRHALLAPKGVDDLHFSPDCARLVVVSQSGERFQAWNTHRGELIKQGDDHRFPMAYLDILLQRIENDVEGAQIPFEILGIDQDGWVRTRGLDRIMWIPFDYRGAKPRYSAGDRTLALTTPEGALVVILFPGL